MTGPDDTWVVRNDRHDPRTLAQFGSVCTISNGYLGLKGTVQEDEGGIPVTLINGIYDELDMFGLLRASAHERPWLDPRQFDAAGRSPAVANLPDPLFVRVFLGGRQVSLGRGEVLNFFQQMDLASGCYSYGFEYFDGSARVRIEAWRFACLADAHRAYMRHRITALRPVALRMVSGISARVHSSMTRERQFVVEHSEARERMCRMQVRTPARGHQVWLEVENRLSGVRRPAVVRGSCGPDAAYTEFDLEVEPGESITLDRLIVGWSSEDQRHEAGLNPRPTPALSFDRALEVQRSAWAALWEQADVEIAGDERAQRYLRFCIYHLLAAAPRFTDRLSVPVKLLSGEYYQGNTFWDTDLYIVPFYTFTFPRLARNCLRFRHLGLEAGRRIAAEQGYAGAKLAWQAGPYGEECLGPWYHFPRTNIHIDADVAYALMQYCRATGDVEFLYRAGVDMLVEFARFYTSRARYRADTDSYHLEDVAGPDEAHCHSTDNLYTNYLAGRTLRWAADTIAQMRRDCPETLAQAVERLGLREDEPDSWRRVAEKLRLLFDPQTRLYEQCAGFFELPPPPADLLDRRRDWFVPLYPYQAMNQPDVLMAMMLFREEFPEDVRRANWEYYKGRSMDFSSMSFPVNAIMAAELGEMEEAYRNFLIAAGMDLDESLTGRHDTYAGLHGTAMGGAWAAAVFGFGGICLSSSELRIHPRLPANWEGLRFTLLLRGSPVRVAIDRQEVTLAVGGEREFSFPVSVLGQSLLLRQGQTYRVRRQ